MNPNEGFMSGTCGGWFNGFQKMQNVQPLGPSGNGVAKPSYPYGVTPVKYFPNGSSSVGRSAWDGWRYGSGYIGPNDGKVYGEPDYKYYRKNYCGPCGCAPPGNMGDANGKNPNVQYVQLDYKNLLGSGFAQQQGLGQSATSQLVLGNGGPPAPTQTSCGRDHCSHCSGVFNKKDQPVKFQVCIGDPTCPETMPPCPKQPLKVYVPNQMIPKCGPGGDEGSDEQQKPQEFEVHIPGQTDQLCEKQQQKVPSTNGANTVNDCGNCKACKNMQKSTSQGNGSCLVRSPLTKGPPAPCQVQAKPRNCQFNGQSYVRGPILANVKKPLHPTSLRKSNCK